MTSLFVCTGLLSHSSRASVELKWMPSAEPRCGPGCSKAGPNLENSMPHLPHAWPPPAVWSALRRPEWGVHACCWHGPSSKLPGCLESPDWQSAASAVERCAWLHSFPPWRGVVQVDHTPLLKTTTCTCQPESRYAWVEGLGVQGVWV